MLFADGVHRFHENKKVAPIPHHYFTLTLTSAKVAEFDSEAAMKRGQQDRVVLGKEVLFDQDGDRIG
jgi:hypothetical protein